jgi:hypothetical protein
MAFVNCSSCQSRVDKEAPNCPRCFSPIQQAKASLAPIVLFPLFALAAMAAIYWGLDRPGDSQPSTSSLTASVEQRQAEARKEAIKKAFSPWDGSHRAMTAEIKRRLKDPGSYEHINTKYIDNGNTISVITTYRAKNSFGGYVVNIVAGEASTSGELLSFESLE